MRAFDYIRPATVDEALRSMVELPHPKFIGGGTNLVDLIREGIEAPDSLVDVAGLGLDHITAGIDSIRVGAAVRNSDLAAHPDVRGGLPLVTEALVSGASGQLRNMATVGGNLLQRTRCLYFYDDAAPCNKRVPGAGCGAREGFHRMGAILGASESCLAAHPSDLCVALAATDAVVELLSTRGTRSVPLVDFHRLPGSTPDVETVLAADELITAVEIPRLPAGMRSGYRKVRDRASYAFALVSVAAAVRVEASAVADVRLALGGVATKPWRASTAEHALLGQPATDESFGRAMDAELEQAVATRDTEFKIGLTRRTAVATLRRLTEVAR
jgi:xanthine dehydrogenase YagS FAD-binding subunit